MRYMPRHEVGYFARRPWRVLEGNIWGVAATPLVRIWGWGVQQCTSRSRLTGQSSRRNGQSFSAPASGFQREHCRVHSLAQIRIAAVKPIRPRRTEDIELECIFERRRAV